MCRWSYLLLSGNSFWQFLKSLFGVVLLAFSAPEEEPGREEVAAWWTFWAVTMVNWSTGQAELPQPTCSAGWKEWCSSSLFPIAWNPTAAAVGFESFEKLGVLHPHITVSHTFESWFSGLPGTRTYPFIVCLGGSRRNHHLIHNLSSREGISRNLGLATLFNYDHCMNTYQKQASSTALLGLSSPTAASAWETGAEPSSGSHQDLLDADFWSDFSHPSGEWQLEHYDLHSDASPMAFA